MDTYETSTTVQAQGRVLVGGVPFAPGTEVRITINAVDGSPAADGERLETVRARMRELFTITRGFRNASLLTREDLYDREDLR